LLPPWLPAEVWRRLARGLEIAFPLLVLAVALGVDVDVDVDVGVGVELVV
jgi:hypothetical protein